MLGTLRKGLLKDGLARALSVISYNFVGWFIFMYKLNMLLLGVIRKDAAFSMFVQIKFWVTIWLKQLQ